LASAFIYVISQIEGMGGLYLDIIFEQFNFELIIDPPNTSRKQLFQTNPMSAKPKTD
jgi:hypothetical protein